MRCICLAMPGRLCADCCVGLRVGLMDADFTNVLTKAQIERLAEADEHELVKEVQVRR